MGFFKSARIAVFNHYFDYICSMKWGFAFATIVLLMACSENGKIADQMNDMPNAKWNYDQIPEFPFTVQNAGLNHDFFLKLRMQKSYPYENLFLLAHIKTPDGRIVTKRVNFTLTDEAGKPLGRSTGGTVNYELPLMMNRKMESAGTYTIALEQNMRDSVIFGIESIGVKIKQGEPVF